MSPKRTDVTIQWADGKYAVLDVDSFDVNKHGRITLDMERVFALFPQGHTLYSHTPNR